MAPIRSLLKALLPLLPLVTTLELAPIPPNYTAEGYIGALPSAPASDLLTSTHCYCKALRIPLGPESAQFIQHEYYNAHLNATFIWPRICHITKANVTNCLPLPDSLSAYHAGLFHDSNGSPDDLGDGDSHADHHHSALCKEYGDTVKQRLCFDWDVGYSWQWWLGTPSTPHNAPQASDFYCDECSRIEEGPPARCLECDYNWGESHYIYFNGQKRGLREYQGQGREMRSQKEIFDLCWDICNDMLGLPLLEDYFPHRQYIYTELDDMCPTCK